MMKQESADEIERDMQLAGTQHMWTASTHIAPIESPPQALSMQWDKGGGSKFVRGQPVPLSVRASEAALDEQCRATLRKLVAAGCTRANHPYSLEQFQVAEPDLHHLKRHGFVHAQASALLQPVLRSFEREKSGADVGKITVVLNVHLY